MSGHQHALELRFLAEPADVNYGGWDGADAIA